MHILLLAIFSLMLCATASAENKPKTTLNEFFNAVSFSSLELSPDGNSVVIGTDRADWDQQIFRRDLWLYRSEANGSLTQLTESGHDTDPKWSPDGRWIAFLSDRKSPDDDSSDNDDGSSDNGGVGQIYLISPAGGEAFAVTRGAEEVHAFSWSPDSKILYFATRNPWTKAQKDEYREQWNDVIEYRTAERGDTIFALDLPTATSNHVSALAKKRTKAEKQSDVTPGARPIAASPWRVSELLTSPDGTMVAWMTNPVNKREEKFDDYEIYSIKLDGSETKTLSAGSGDAAHVHRVTQNNAVEKDLQWANDSRHIFFTIQVGDVSGPYRDLQPHLYSVDVVSGAVEQWGKDFTGPVDHYSVAAHDIFASARTGTEVQMYSVSTATHALRSIGESQGTYDLVSVGRRTPRVAFVYSSLNKPIEVYLADNSSEIKSARPITAFNALFTERDLPQGKPYRWKADDGTSVEGMLIYPPGKFEAKNLPMFTFIHGGPADADGNQFEADWYQWGILAATNGWLVFEPNYRGSSGYGDKFLMQIVPQIVSRPGKDILEGVDALVKDGTADPDLLSLGGYSYGGYMTNWLITQSTRWKAAVTGAGAVEHVGNWGNDDTTFDDAYFLGGRPWEAAQRYHDEAAIFQIDKVRTPTHIVAGADDIRVAVLEDYLLEHALYTLGIPNKLLIFPGEGHSLDKNPWHGKIKVREELKWLQKYGGVSSGGE